MLAMALSLDLALGKPGPGFLKNSTGGHITFPIIFFCIFLLYRILKKGRKIKKDLKKGFFLKGK